MTGIIVLNCVKNLRFCCEMMCRQLYLRVIIVGHVSVGKRSTEQFAVHLVSCCRGGKVDDKEQ